jgi:2-keto-4-pentenoate hydratase/2-oxohepta-3-ene-1,7-dioic acid hydratase in catechol pathway
VHETAKLRLLPPLPTCGTIWCIGLNYPKLDPISGKNVGKPAIPTIFVKTRAALVGHREPLVLDDHLTTQFDYENELALVIARGGRHIAVADALSHVAGYTILNDGSARDWQKASLCSGKNFFASGGCGPWLCTADEVGDPSRLTLATRLNGDEVQSTSTSAMLWSVAEIIHHISTFAPLAAGDVISTGSPEGSGASRNPQRFLTHGDTLEMEIESIGVLRNRVA